jgi:choline-sulfatase
MDRSNVVLIVLDSLRKDRVSVYNDEIDFTPNIEEVAEESRVYSNANAQAPWTLPSVTSIFTGKYPWEHGATHGHGYYSGSEKLLGERFEEKGYRTKLATPNVWISSTAGNIDGFQSVENFLGLASREPLKTLMEKSNKAFSYLPIGLRGKIMDILTGFQHSFLDKFSTIDSEKTVREGIRFLEDVEDENFFLFINVLSPHEPYDNGNPPKKYLEKHDVDTEKVPGTEKEYFQRDDVDLEEFRKAYDAAADFTDDLVGRIHNAIKENDLEDDTYFVIISDHGQALGQEGLFGHQFTLMDEVIETPLIISGPEIDSERVEEVFELRQLYNLLPSLAGISEERIQPLGEARGGYEFPDSYKNIVPDEKKDEIDRKLRYVKDSKTKVVKSTGRSGDENYTATDLESGENVEPEEELRQRVNNTEAENCETLEPEEAERDEEVKKRLEKLGYM